MKSRKRKQQVQSESEEEVEAEVQQSNNVNNMEEDDEKVNNPISALQDHGVNANDINHLKKAGYNSVESLLYTTKKMLIQVKGISENKVDKILEAGKSLIKKIIKKHKYYFISVYKFI